MLNLRHFKNFAFEFFKNNHNYLTEKKDIFERCLNNITSVLKENTTIPVSSKGKATFTPEKRKLDASAPFGHGMTNLNSGVNESKTIYTDDLGRLHFFGKANKIKD